MPSFSSSIALHNDEDYITGLLTKDIDDWNMLRLPLTDVPKVDLTLELTGNNQADLDHSVMAVASFIHANIISGSQGLGVADQAEPTDAQQAALSSFFWPGAFAVGCNRKETEKSQDCKPRIIIRVF